MAAAINVAAAVTAFVIVIAVIVIVIIEAPIINVKRKVRND
jgi:hypothetical protein